MQKKKQQYKKYKKHHEKISQKTSPEMINTKDRHFMGVVVFTKLHMSGEPITRRKQLPYYAYVTAFLRTGLF